MAYYFISLGSNINPKLNFSLMIDKLLTLSKEVVLSRVIETTAEGLESDQQFLNGVARIHTYLTPEQLKDLFNGIERDLGRDRDDPQSKVKDRVADLDILFKLSEMGCSAAADQLPSEPYVRPLLIELLNALGYHHGAETPEVPAGADLLWRNQPIGEMPYILKGGRRHTINNQRLNELIN